MKELTTDDCKAALDRWLDTQYKDPSPAKGKWKRISKKKDEKGTWVRLFENKVWDLSVTIVEAGARLVITKVVEVQDSPAATAITPEPESTGAPKIEQDAGIQHADNLVNDILNQARNEPEQRFDGYIFAFGYGLQDGTVNLGIMTARTWAIEGHLDDQHQGLDITWLDEICESTFVSSHDKQTTYDKLTAMGMKFHHGLSECLNQWGDEDEKKNMDVVDKKLARLPNDQPYSEDDADPLTPQLPQIISQQEPLNGFLYCMIDEPEDELDPGQSAFFVVNALRFRTGEGECEHIAKECGLEGHPVFQEIQEMTFHSKLDTESTRRYLNIMGFMESHKLSKQINS